jgi:glutamine synthetase
MILLPDPDTAMMDPFTEHSTVSFVCNVLDAITREPYSRDPRFVTQKAEKYLKSSGIADTSYWGPEIEFFIFDSIRFDTTKATTISTPPKVFGTPVTTTCPISATRSDTKKDIFRCRRWINTRIYAPRWC